MYQEGVVVSTDTFRRGFHRLVLLLSVPVAILWTVGALFSWVLQGPPDNEPLYGAVSVMSGLLLAIIVYGVVLGVPLALRWAFRGFRAT
jgi:hypothetical protein